MATTTDFLGTYDYAEEEAFNEALQALDIWNEGDKDYYHQWLIKSRNHWYRVFDDKEEFKQFVDCFNKHTSEITNIYM